jgi:hypothetical protein
MRDTARANSSPLFDTLREPAQTRQQNSSPKVRTHRLHFVQTVQTVQTKYPHNISRSNATTRPVGTHLNPTQRIPSDKTKADDLVGPATPEIEIHTGSPRVRA